MTGSNQHMSRRAFLGGVAGAAVGAVLPPASSASVSQTFSQNTLQVWSCGGLAEAFMLANVRFKEITGVEVAYTGAFAAALGKSLLGGATTEVFAGRVLGLAKKLRSAGKMVSFRPLCFTRYVLVTPKGNPAGISDIQDLVRADVRVILAPEASPPGGKAVGALLKKAGVLEVAMRQAVVKGSCVQRTMGALIRGKGDVSVVEYRLTRLPAFRDKTEIIPIDPHYFPPAPLTFTIGVMQDARERILAEHYVDYICSPEGQACFETAGFIPSISAQGQRLVRELGVSDV